jgi:acyl carrier protein
MHNGIAAQVRAFIEENFLFATDLNTLSEAQSLIDAGVVDSTGILELVAFLEERFGITVLDADIVPDNLDSVSSIAAYVERRRSATSVAA